MNRFIDKYLKERYPNVITFNEDLFKQYVYYIISKFIDLDNKKIVHIFNGLNHKRQNIFYAYLLNTPINYICGRYHFYARLKSNLYIEYLQSECSNLSVFIIKSNKRIYLRRYNFSILPTIKYILKKLETDPDFLAPLITTTLIDFYNFYQIFYNSIIELRQILNIYVERK